MGLIAFIVCFIGIISMHNAGVPVTDFINKHPFWTLVLIDLICSNDSSN